MCHVYYQHSIGSLASCFVFRTFTYAYMLEEQILFFFYMMSDDVLSFYLVASLSCVDFNSTSPQSTLLALFLFY